MTIILDLGGVLMQHNMPECIARFCDILGEEAMTTVLGMKPNAEGVPNSLMDQFECGNVTAQQFINTILQHATPGTTQQDVINAWNAMHAGIPIERWEQVHAWKQAGHRLLLLSNNNELHWEDIHRHYDFSIFDKLFSSHLSHCNKPNREIYEQVQHYLTDNQYEAPYYFVDDLAANRKMGEQFGWHTFPTLADLDAILK